MELLHQSKENLSASMFDWLQLENKEISLNVKSIRLDNSGENKSFHQIVQKSNYNIKSQCTAPGTPQQNGKGERAFATLYGKTRSMQNSARLTTTLGQRQKLSSPIAKHHCQRKN
jgi:transposase InsO family protein